MAYRAIIAAFQTLERFSAKRADGHVFWRAEIVPVRYMTICWDGNDDMGS
jgi:hypothetical protein